MRDVGRDRLYTAPESGSSIARTGVMRRQKVLAFTAGGLIHLARACTHKRAVIALQRGGDASRTKTQSSSPDLLAPEGINCLLPSLANGEPFTFAYSPLVGSYQRAVVVPVSFDISTVMARIVGM